MSAHFGHMAAIPEHITPERWVNQLFSSQEALSGGVVKRKLRDVERLVGRDAFAREVERRGFQAIHNNRHIVIFCNKLPVRRLR